MHRKKLGSAIWASKEVVEREMCIGGGCGARIVHRRKLRSVNCASGEVVERECAAEDQGQRRGTRTAIDGGTGGEGTDIKDGAEDGPAPPLAPPPGAARGDAHRHRRRCGRHGYNRQRRGGGRSGPPLTSPPGATPRDAHRHRRRRGEQGHCCRDDGEDRAATS